GPVLKCPAAAVRAQGRAAGGVAGIRLSARASVTWFGAVATGPGSDSSGAGEPVVVTVAGSTGALPGTGAATVKLTPYGEYPPKGRATGGGRRHRVLKGEDTPGLALGGPGPAPRAPPPGGLGGPAGGRRPQGRPGYPGTPAPGCPGRPGSPGLTGRPSPPDGGRFPCYHWERPLHRPVCPGWGRVSRDKKPAAAPAPHSPPAAA